MFLRLAGKGVAVHRESILVHPNEPNTDERKNILREDLKPLLGYILGIFQLVMEDDNANPPERVPAELPAEETIQGRGEARRGGVRRRARGKVRKVGK